MKKNCGYLKNAISIFISIQAFLFFLIKLDIHLQSIVDTAQIENGYVWSGIMHTVQCLYVFTI